MDNISAWTGDNNNICHHPQSVFTSERHCSHDSRAGFEVQEVLSVFRFSIQEQKTPTYKSLCRVPFNPTQLTYFNQQYNFFTYSKKASRKNMFQ